jgi:hypothetical protein
MRSISSIFDISKPLFVLIICRIDSTKAVLPETKIIKNRITENKMKLFIMGGRLLLLKPLITLSPVCL